MLENLCFLTELNPTILFFLHVYQSKSDLYLGRKQCKVTSHKPGTFWDVIIVLGT